MKTPTPSRAVIEASRKLQAKHWNENRKEDRPHVNAAMPTAPRDYPWEHLKKPARFA